MYVDHAQAVRRRACAAFHTGCGAIIPVILLATLSGATAGQDKAHAESIITSREKEAVESPLLRAAPAGKLLERLEARKVKKKPKDSPEESDQGDATDSPILFDFSAEPLPEEPAKEQGQSESGQAAKKATETENEPAADISAAAPRVSWWQRNRSSLQYCGYGLAGSGLVALGVGIYFGVHSRSLTDSIHEDTSQIKAGRLFGQADDAATRANVLYVVAGAAAVAGAALVVLPYIMDTDTQATATVSVQPGGVFAVFAAHW